MTSIKNDFLDENYQEILNFIKNHRSEIVSPKNAARTVRALGLLEKTYNNIDMSKLNQEFYNLTGFGLHEDNFPNRQVLQATVDTAAKILKERFDRAASDYDRLHLMNYCLNLGSCFEIRAEMLQRYDEKSRTLLGLLTYEIYEFNRIKDKGQSDPVDLNEFMEFLSSRYFFEDHHFKKEEALKDSAIEQLIHYNLILSNAQKPAEDRIYDAFAIYSDYGSGLDHFREHILEKADLSTSEKEDVDALIQKFKDKYSEEAKFI